MCHETPPSLEKDGFRAQLAVHTSGRLLLRSRQGTDMTSVFSEIREAALAQLPADTGLDGELVVWESGWLAFERLQQRLARHGTGAVEAARHSRAPAPTSASRTSASSTPRTGPVMTLQ